MSDDPLRPSEDEVIEAFREWFPMQFEITVLRLQNRKARLLVSDQQMKEEGETR